MPSSHMYGNVGVDVLYPTSAMNPSQFSESEWANANVVRLDDYDFGTGKQPGDELAYPRELPINPTQFEPAYPISKFPAPPPIQISPVPSHVSTRPKSSPSTFGPNVEDLLFTQNPFRIRHEDTYPTSTYSMSPIQIPTTATSSLYEGEQNLSTPILPTNRLGPIPIAPDPVGLRQLDTLKRMREDDEHLEYGQRKRKRATSQSGPVELNEEEQLLLRLKEEENLPWKDIATRFQTDVGKSYQVPALQMRFKRLRERMRSWTESDVQALEQAYDYWEKFQFDIIAAKMLDFGASERWPAKYCARKWQEMHPTRAPIPAHNFLQDPWDTEHPSPIDTSISPGGYQTSPLGIHQSPMGFHRSPRSVSRDHHATL